MRAGDLRYRLTLQSPTRTQDAYGQPIATWGDVDTVWADIRSIRGREFLAAAETQSEVTTQIVIRHRDDVTTQWRAVEGAHIYNIRAVLPDPRRTMLRLMCDSGVKPE